MGRVAQARRELDFSKELAEKGWYHSFELPDGTVIEGHQSLDRLRRRYGNFPIPSDLHGKRVLDIGAWDGWFSFEAERHGAAVTAIDCVEIPNFLRMHKKLGSRVDYKVLDFFDLPKEGFEPFDYVFFLGVLYHLKHPLLALEMACAMTKEVAIVDSFVTNGATFREVPEDVPTLEFYETDELGGHQDNWFGPTVGALLALCRAAGFARLEILETHSYNVAVACHRRHEPVPQNLRRDAPGLRGVRHGWNGGVNFYTSREEYLAWWLTGLPEGAKKEDVLLEVDGFGVPTIYLRPVEGGVWQANSRLPPGLSAGWREARARLRDSGYSEPARIAVDMAPRSDEIVVNGVRDSRTWIENEVELAGEATFASCWIAGLGENADQSNIRIYLDGERVENAFVGEPDKNGARQVNVKLGSGMPRGARELVVKFGQTVSAPRTVMVR
ncbi:MAG: DUF1698 domain-containing protein [Bryobacteraceae bacterium]|nr:DUF1698 domain-containing protein [Bryobacteraceae bacterium]